MINLVLHNPPTIQMLENAYLYRINLSAHPCKTSLSEESMKKNTLSNRHKCVVFKETPHQKAYTQQHIVNESIFRMYV